MAGTNHKDTVSPHFSPVDAKIAQDFCRQRVPATESIAVAMVEEARARWRQKDKRGCIKRSLLCRYGEQIIITY